MKERSSVYDVVVIGGGLAGIAAAISAARQGCRVALVQDRPVLGGNSSSEIKVPIVGAGCFNNPWARETGILEELFIEDRKRNAGSAAPYRTNSTWDLVLYEKTKYQKKLHLFLNTSARRAFTRMQEGSKSIKEIECIQLGTEKVLRIKGKIFVDASGDGSIACSAGAEFRVGREGREEFGESLAPEKPDDCIQGSSLIFHAQDTGQVVPFQAPSWAINYPSDENLPFRDHSDIEAGYWWIEIGSPFDTISDNEKIRDELLRHLLGVWDHIKNHGEHGAENYALDWIGMVPGKRESRRFVGDHILTENDLQATTLFPDRVAYGGWLIDVHTPGGILAKHEPPEPTFLGKLNALDKRLVPIYSIPFRCLYSRNIENLMVAGRNISVTHVALGSTRLMGTGAVIGQAVGTAACLCVKYNTNPRGIYHSYIDELQQLLLKQDCYIPMLENHDRKDLARGATVAASSTATLEFGGGERPEKIWTHEILASLERMKRGELNILRSQLFPITENHINSISLLLESQRSENTEIQLGLRKAKTVWDFDSQEDICIAKASVLSHSVSWVTFNLNHPIIAHKLYWIYVAPTEKIFWKYSENAPVGTVAACRCINRWIYQKGSYSVRIDPSPDPYQPKSVLSGVTRPERWTNLWISDPHQLLPQHLELDFGEEKTFNTAYLVFDTNLNRVRLDTRPLFRAPECVRDYNLYCWKEGTWKIILQIQGNYQRRRVHRFSLIKSSKIKLEICATNGVKTARVYEVRIYHE